MTDLFELAEGEPSLTIEIVRKGENLEFNSIDELETYGHNLPAKITTMKWCMYDLPDRSCRLESTFIVGLAVVATAATEVWCASAIAVVESHVIRNKLWYSFIQRWILLLPALILGFVPLLSDRFLHHPMSTVAIASVVVLQYLFWAIYLSHNRLLPRHVLVIRLEENWLRRYSTELTIGLAALSSIIALIALFYR
jgi:hypothetical protein